MIKKTLISSILIFTILALFYANLVDANQMQITKKQASNEFIRHMPKAELHLHIEGTLEPELMFRLAKRNNVKFPYSSVEEAKRAYQFKDLQSFLNLYYIGMSVLKSEQDFYDLTWEYLKKAHADNIIHTEIFFDPQPHLENGVAFSTMIIGMTRALNRAKTELNISSNLIMCFLRDKSQDDAEKVLDLALPYRHLITAIGLDSSEVGNPPEKFKSVFDRARTIGFKTVAHAGEEGPSEYVIQALDLLKVSRIDHGIRSLENESLVARLISEQVPLTICPLSNVKLKVFQTIYEHPIKKMLRQGLFVTVNSDDPAYFGGYLNDNYIQVNNALSLSYQEAYTLAKNSFEASFLDSSIKNDYIKQLDEYYHGLLHY